MKKEEKQFFKKLVEAPSPSGFEQPAQNIYREFVKEYADEVNTDVHGNVIALKKGSGNLKFMVCGHADEIGLMISYIDDNGYLYFRPIGGVDASILPGKRVNVYHNGKAIRGVIGRKAVHLLKADERSKAPKIEDLWIDIGVKDKKEALKKVAVGDVITFDPGMEILFKDIITSKATDNKVGVYIAAMVLKELAEEEVVANIYGVSSVQEEVGLRGATTSAYGVNPDVAIVIDVTHATDYPGVDKKVLGEVSLGKGPVVSVGASINPIVLNILKESAKKAKIDIQIDIAPRGTGTDTDAVQLSRGGVATGLISIPNRYMHTPSEVISLNDVDSTVKLIAEFLRNINDETSFIPS